MTAGPEHFAAIADRFFVRLKEMPMFAEPSPISTNLDVPDADTVVPPHAVHDADGSCCDRGAALAMQHLPSADDHYRELCNLLARIAPESYNIAERRTLVEEADLRLRAAEYALRRWPGTARDDDHGLLDDNRTLANEVARLLPVVRAAVTYVNHGDETVDHHNDLVDVVAAFEALR